MQVCYNNVDTSESSTHNEIVTTMFTHKNIMNTQIRRIGNSLGSIIPAPVIRQLNLEKGAEMQVRVEGSRIIYEPITLKKKRFPLSEAELLMGLDSHGVHADEMAAVSAAEFGE